MKKVICLLLYVSVSMFACKSAIDVSPIVPQAEQAIVDPFDYNFVATPDFERLIPISERYNSVIELYYNPFEEIAQNTTATLKFESSKFATFIIEKDTLYPGDQIKFPVSKFVNKRIYGQLFTIQRDNLNTTFTMTVRTNSKSKTINYTLL